MDQKAMFKFTYGLYLLTAQQDGKDNGCIVNTAGQVAENPVRVSVSVLKANLTCDMIEKTGLFNISAISTDAKFALFQRFGMQSGRNADKFDGFPSVARMDNGLYYLTTAANMALSAKVVERYDLGTHMLFVGEVTDAKVLCDTAGCTYDYYQTAIKPKPQTPIDREKTWICQVCGYVYEGAEVPDDFICPLCHHGKADFIPC